MFPSDNCDDVDPSAAGSKDGQPAAAESGQFTPELFADFCITNS